MITLRLVACTLLTLVVVSEGWSQTGGGTIPPFSEAPRPATPGELRAKLEATYSAEFVETPLKDVIAYSADFLEVQIVVDVRALEEIGVSIDAPVTINLRNVTAKTGLEVILNQVNEQEVGTLQVVRRDGFLEISTRDRLDRQLEPRIYPVRDLPGVTANSPDVSLAVNLIETAVEPTTWETRGGEGTIVPYGPILVIRQSPRVHDRIDDLIHEAREAIEQATKP